MLGWKTTAGGEYRIRMPRLSEEEERLLKSAEQELSDAGKGKDAGHMTAEIRSKLSEMGRRGGLSMDPDQLDYLAKVAYSYVFGLGGFQELLGDPEIEEIGAVGVGKPVYVFLRNRGWMETNLVITDERYLMDVANKMARESGRRLTYQTPRMNANLPEGSRLHASIYPISKGELTIRKFSEKPFTPADLVRNGTLGLEACALLSLAFQSDMNIVIAGNTASGKTTTLNAMFAFVPLRERVLILEETPEINVPHPQQVRLVSNPEMGVGLADLIEDSLRMRPDRAVIGEVRSRGEMGALVDSMLAGQARGCYATMHGKSVEEALKRMRFLGVSEEDEKSVDLLIVQRRSASYDLKTRRAVERREITEIAMHSDAGKLVPVLRGGKLAGKNMLLGAAADCLGLSAKEAKKECDERKGIVGKRMGFGEYAEYIGRKLFGG